MQKFEQETGVFSKRDDILVLVEEGVEEYKIAESKKAMATMKNIIERIIYKGE